MLKRYAKKLHGNHALSADESAFTLAETCIALGMGSILVLALSQYSLFSARSKKSQTLSNDFTEAVSIAGQVLSNEVSCTSTLTSSPIIAQASPIPLTQLATIPPGDTVARTVIATGALTSGLVINSITIGNFQTNSVLPVNGYQQGLIDITITATKGSPTASPSPSINATYVGNSTYTKTFTVGIWASTALGNQISKCISSQDTANRAPVNVTTYATPGVSCPNPTPTCATGSPVCCSGAQIPVPYWGCAANGWSC